MVSALQYCGFRITLPFVLQRAQQGKEFLSQFQHLFCWCHSVPLILDSVSLLHLSDLWVPWNQPGIPALCLLIAQPFGGWELFQLMDGVCGGFTPSE